MLQGTPHINNKNNLRTHCTNKLHRINLAKPKRGRSVICLHMIKFGPNLVCLLVCYKTTDKLSIDTWLKILSC